jgi:hypothetical protein
MPDLTISVTAAQSTRICTALGKWVTPDPVGEDPPGPPVWTLATAGEVTAEIKRLLKRQVEVYEKNTARQAADVAVNDELDTEGWNA